MNTDKIGKETMVQSSLVTIMNSLQGRIVLEQWGARKMAQFYKDCDLILISK